MTNLERYGYLAPFPFVPGGIKAGYSPGKLFLRPFGLFENDLEVDFNQKLRPCLVTQILKCCAKDEDGKTPEEAFFGELTIGKRIECLLIVAALKEPSNLSLRFRCSGEACRQQMEVEIFADEISAIQSQADKTERLTVRVEGMNLSVRKPTGSDQLEWLKGSPVDEGSAIKIMIQTLMSDGKRVVTIPDGWVQAISDAMEGFDPLVNFSLLVQCPFCGRENRHEVDLEELSLGKLREAQLRLLSTVHRLATRYHWSERQIFSIPPWRRSHYLALIEKEEGR